MPHAREKMVQRTLVGRAEASIDACGSDIIEALDYRPVEVIRQQSFDRGRFVTVPFCELSVDVPIILLSSGHSIKVSQERVAEYPQQPIEVKFILRF